MNIAANRSALTPDQLERGWRYTTADLMATLQTGLMQWIFGNAITVIPPSDAARSGI